VRAVVAAPGRVAAVAGVGFTPFTRASGQSVLALAAGAVAGAVADAGLRLDEVDGMHSFMVSDDSVPCVAVSSALGLGQLRTVLDVQLGGQAPCHLVWQAAQSVARGDAEVVVVYRALNGRSGARVGSMQFAGMGGQYRYPIGYGAYLMYVGMWGQRFLYETGQGPEDLGAVAVGQRRYAQDNERAARRQPLELEAYLAEPYVVEPYRRSDCTVEVDGACAVVVTSLERARDLVHPPAVVASGCYRAGPRPGLDIGDHLLWEDYTRNYTSWLRDELFGRAGIGQGDVDVAEIYDCFTSTVLMGLEGLGLCARGESGAFVRSGATALDGSLPTNTAGGLLAEGYLHGMNTVAEAVLQVQGRGGVRQAPRHEVAVVTSGALMDGSAMILTADR
jgi:acetyl-CoA acetyltransferase